MTNKLYKDIVLEVDIDAKKGAQNQAKETQATFYSYDIQSGLVKINIAKDGQPLALSNGTEVLINVVKLGSPQQKLVYTADTIDTTKGVTHWEIPESLIGYKGKVRVGVFINLPNGQRLHGGYFKFNMGISEIDNNLDEFEEDFWQGWDEFQKNAEATWSDWEAIRDDVWKKYVEKYEAWKKDQENKQTKFENDTEKRLSDWLKEQERVQTEFVAEYNSWKKKQEGKQTTFENEFLNWKSEQENKQSDFETNTNKIHENINKDIDDIEKRVNETNESLGDLDTYNRQQIDTKLDNKANKSSIEEIKNAVEHGFITLETGFENYNNSNTESDRAGQLQYVKVGPLCHIFGTVKNLSTIKSGGEIVVATMPSHLSVKTMDRTVCQGSSNDTFACTAYGSAQPFPNQITITRTRDGGGKNIDFTSGKWLNISLTIRV